MDSKLSGWLNNLGIKCKEYEHPAVFTVQESRKLTEPIPGKRSKSLFLKDESGSYYLITLLGEKRLNTSYLRKKLGIKKLEFASPQEMEKELKVKPGSVSLFCIINSDKTMLILDEELWDAELSGYHPNINTSTLVLDHENLKKFYDSLKCKKEIFKLE